MRLFVVFLWLKNDFMFKYLDDLKTLRSDDERKSFGQNIIIF